MWDIDTYIIKATAIFLSNNTRKLKNIQNFRKRGHADLFDYVYGLVKGLEIFQDIPPEERRPKKSNKEADKYRQMGNKRLIEDDIFVETVKSYTKAVANAELGSESLSIAYSNRSQTLLENAYINECLQDIERAFQCNCPDHIKDKLLHRQKRAIKLKDYQKVHIFHDPVPKIKERNKFIKSASSSIALNHNEKWGRHVVANKNIKLGEVLVIEDPYVSQVDYTDQYLHCHECFELCYNMIACDNCSEALYCSEKCKEQAYEMFHKYECILIEYHLFTTKSFLRLTLKSIFEYEKLMKDLSEIDDHTYRSDRYKEIYKLETVDNSKHPMTIFEDVLEPVLFYHYLKKYTNIFKDLSIKNKERVFKELLVSNYNIMMEYVFGIQKIEGKFVNLSRYRPIGLGIYSFFSLFHHSCTSNSFPYFYGKKLVVRASRDIKKGDRITTSMGSVFSNAGKMLMTLEPNEFYICKCDNAICLTKHWNGEGSTLQKLLKQGEPIPGKFSRKVTKVCTEDVDSDLVNKVVAEGYEIYRNRPFIKHTANDLRFLNQLIELFLCLGNRDLEDF